MARVTVDKEALDALIEYANGKRDQSDSQFLAGKHEYEESEQEFDALVARLAISGASGT